MVMQNIASKIKRLSLVFLICVSCVEPYEPPVVENSISILIVDGSLNTQGKSLIRLTRSQNIAEAEKIQVPVELNALVSFEDENGGDRKSVV